MQRIMYIALLMSQGFPLMAAQQVGLQTKKYVIGIPEQCGFFSIFFATLVNIAWAKKHGREPVVYWQKKCAYMQEGGHNGATEPWEYYFEPVSELKYEPGDLVHASQGDPNEFGIPNGPGCYDRAFHSKVKHEMHEAITKYIRIKSVIQKKIDDFYDQYLKGKAVIGIHLRGTDKDYEATPINHQKVLEQVVRTIKALKPDCYFFIATDEERLLTLAKKILGVDRVISYNSRRSLDGYPVHYLPKHDGAICGEEILIETQLLARCDIFVHTRSNVATAVMLWNPKIKSVFMEN
jgi:hypothetical protein